MAINSKPISLDKFAQLRLKDIRERKAAESGVVERDSTATKGNNGEAGYEETQGAAEAYGLGFNIGNFKAEMDQYSILHSHSYLVVFAPFSAKASSYRDAANTTVTPSLSNTGDELNSYIMDDVGTLVLRCDQAVLPGPRMLTVDNVRRYGYGPVETHAHGVQFQNITLSWIVDRNARIIDFFNKWMKRVVNYESEGGGNMELDQTFGRVQFSPYEVGYKDDYSNSLMAVYVYDPELNKAIEYLIYDVFPTAIHNTDVQWGSENSMLRISVDFAYTDVRINTPRSSRDLPTRVRDKIREPAKSPVIEDGIALNMATQNLPKAISGRDPTAMG